MGQPKPRLPCVKGGGTALWAVTEGLPYNSSPGFFLSSTFLPLYNVSQDGRLGFLSTKKAVGLVLEETGFIECSKTLDIIVPGGVYFNHKTAVKFKKRSVTILEFPLFSLFITIFVTLSL